MFHEVFRLVCWRLQTYPESQSEPPSVDAVNSLARVLGGHVRKTTMKKSRIEMDIMTCMQVRMSDMLSLYQYPKLYNIMLQLRVDRNAIDSGGILRG